MSRCIIGGFSLCSQLSAMAMSRDNRKWSTIDNAPSRRCMISERSLLWKCQSSALRGKGGGGRQLGKGLYYPPSIYSMIIERVVGVIHTPINITSLGWRRQLDRKVIYITISQIAGEGGGDNLPHNIYFMLQLGDFLFLLFCVLEFLYEFFDRYSLSPASSLIDSPILWCFEQHVLLQILFLYEFLSCAFLFVWVNLQSGKDKNDLKGDSKIANLS